MRAAATLLLALLTATTTWADDVTLSVDSDIAEGTAGHYYVNMPATGTNTLTLSDATVTTFKIYDDGGKGGNYSDNCSGTLVLTAPEGYVLQLSGSITTENYDKLTVYDGSTTSGTKLLDAVSTTSIGTALTTVVSNGQSMMLYFYSDGSFNYAGLDLTVTLVSTSTEYAITVGNATGGSVASNKSTANVNEAVTLTATPESGYLLSGISVTDGSGNAVAVAWDGPFFNTATFTMPPSAVTVTPTFTNDLTSLYINMPKTGTQTATIPTGVQSFKVYDDGGASEYYSNNCDGYLTLNAPEGYVIQLAGRIKAYRSDFLTVYDGDNASARKLLDAVRSTANGTETTITTVVSSGRSMTLYFYSDSEDNYSYGLNLTVTLVDASTEYDLTVINPATGGSVAATVGGQTASMAKVNEVVTLTATPSEGYVLYDLSVKDGSGNDVAVTDMRWYTGTNTATFTMPGSAVTVTPTFTNLTDVYVNMPTRGYNTLTLNDASVTTFKVYDDGGKDGNYSDLCDGHLTLTAPEGYVLQLEGSIKTENGHDFLSVYDGTDVSRSTLLDQVSSTTVFGNEKTITPVVSSGRSMTLWFYSNSYTNFEDLGWRVTHEGLNLTVTLVDVNTQFALTVSPVTGGSVATTVGEQTVSTAKVNEVVTLTATPSDGYLVRDLSVKDGSGNDVAVTDMLWYTGTNTATFTMPASAVTVTPTFTNTLTADCGLYINMPKTGTKNAIIPTGVQSFKVYDDGGKDGEYSKSSNGYLTLTAPEGYVLQLSGSITTDKGSDFLTVYDGGDSSASTLLDAVSSTDYAIETTITTVISSGQSMTLYFCSDGDIYYYDGLNLTVTLINLSTEYDLTVNSVTGGSVAATVGGQAASTAKMNDVVTLTATPSDGYVLWDLSVKDGNDNDVAVTDMLWYTGKNTATFTMPVSAVTVTPTFTTLTDVFVNIPKSGTKTVNIPTGLQSFKVYDDGGADGNYSDQSDGTLILTAPAGYVLQLSGSIKTQSGYDLLTVYDGGDDSAATLLNEVSSTSNGEETAITTVNSTGQSMTLWFGSGSSNNFGGLDLTVTLIDINTEFTLTVSPTTGGSVAATVGGQTSSTPKVNDVVTLTATPSEGYLLCDLSINGNNVSVTDMLWYTGTNTATFTMPASATTVTPTFTNTLTADGGLYINMPKSGTTTATIPAGVQSFKLYDDGGMSDIYSNLCDGVLILTAPAGYMLQLAGSIRTQKDYDKLTVYDGSDTSASKLLDAVSSTSSDTETTINTVSSSGQSMTLLFYSNGYRNYDGLDLTVTLVPITYTVSFNANGGTGDTMAAQNFTYDAAQTLTANSYTRTGYTFAGWATTADGDVVYTDQQSVSNLTTEPNGNVELYAKWTPSGNISLTANAHDGNLWTTFYCGDAGYTIDDGENACAYTAEYDGTNHQLTLHNQGKEIPQGTAVIIVADNNEVSMTKASLDAFSGENSLRGVDVETSTADIQTTLGDGTFYVLGMTVVGSEKHFGFHKYEGTTMAARKAFVLVNGSNAALARSLTMVFDDATGIKALSTDSVDAKDDGAWYTLDGRKLQGMPAKSGLYISNGHKIVIK